MRQDTVCSDKREKRNHNVQASLAGGAIDQSKRDAERPRDRIQQETRDGIAKVKVPWTHTPVGGFALDGVVDEAYPFRPQGESLPEVRVNRDSHTKADNDAHDPGRDDLVDQRCSALEQQI